MNEHKKFSVLLPAASLVDGVGDVSLLRLFRFLLDERFRMHSEDLEALLLSGSVHQLCSEFGLSLSVAKRLSEQFSEKKIESASILLDEMERRSVTFLPFFDTLFPTRLLEIPHPPAFLTVYGSAEILSSVMLGIVGSRAADRYSERFLKNNISEIVDAGIVVVSGGAIGADTMAHKATLSAGGKTVSVVGSGLFKLYPSSNLRVFEQIVESGGAVVSIFLPYHGVERRNFPVRNRVISGLSVGLLVLQAAERSGALITASYALEQGRELFAVPGSVFDRLSAGTNRLILNGAKPVFSANDIIEEFSAILHLENDKAQAGLSRQQKDLLSENFSGQSTVAAELFDSMETGSERTKRSGLNRKSKEASGIDSGISSNKLAIVDLLNKVKQISIDEMVELLQIDLDELDSLLFELQMEGVVDQDFSGLWFFSG
jgi:DNA protecting protein DprA